MATTDCTSLSAAAIFIAVQRAFVRGNRDDRREAVTSIRLLLMGILVVLAVTACSSPAPRRIDPTPTVGPVEAKTPNPIGSSGVAPTAIRASTPVSVSATPIPTAILAPAAPEQLAQRTAEGAQLPPGGWAVGSVRLTFHVNATTTDPLVPEVAVASADQPLPSEPTAQGSSVTPAEGGVDGQVTVQGLPASQYRWQARFRDSTTGSVGPWSPFASGDTDFGLVANAPTIGDLTVTGTHPAQDGSASIGAADQPVLHWTISASTPAALDHLVYLADHQATSDMHPPPNGQVISTTETSLDLSDLADGSWSLHLWALDKAGQVSTPATFQVTVAKTAPQIVNVVFRSWPTNPTYQTVSIRFEVSRPVSATVTIMPVATTDPVRTYSANGTHVDLAWDGKDAQGKIAPNGSYRFLINVTDVSGNSAQAMYNGLQISDKVIEITLSTESLTASAGGKVFLKTMVTSGGQRLPTPTGSFQVQEKSAPFVFHSPYPKGSPYWYADVTSHEAMLFDPSGANFLHDAPWRSIFGPGTNGPGIPGSTYDGSHGCVELPLAAMHQLYPWTPLGTPVVVTN
jgi:L,D-transpeptidase catalytic domain